jgi:glutamate formiminotransferase
LADVSFDSLLLEEEPKGFSFDQEHNHLVASTPIAKAADPIMSTPEEDTVLYECIKQRLDSIELSKLTDPTYVREELASEVYLALRSAIREMKESINDIRKRQEEER